MSKANAARASKEAATSTEAGELKAILKRCVAAADATITPKLGPSTQRGAVRATDALRRIVKKIATERGYDWTAEPWLQEEGRPKGPQ